MSRQEKMRMKTFVIVLATTVGAAHLASAEGRWSFPTNQWECVYAASNGLPEVADANWLRSGGYQSTDPAGGNYVAITNDGNEGDVLMLIHTNSASATNRWPIYSMTSAPGSGTTNDLITMDLRFRLADNSKPDATPQLTLIVNRPRLDGSAGRNYWLLQFAKNSIQRNGAAVNGTTLGTDWHTMRLIIDVAANNAKVYFDNVTAPVVSNWASAQDAVAYNYTMFGDGASTVIGIAEIKYFQWTTHELVEPLTWVHNGGMDPLNEGWSYDAGVKDLFYTASNGLLPEASLPVWTKRGFEAGGTSIATDEITGEKALHLIMTNTASSWAYASYNQTSAEGMFATNQITTCRMRFRLVDETQTDSQAQFMCALNGPRPDGVTGRQMFYVSFAKDRIRYYNDSSMVSYMVEVSTNWHELIWTQNWRTREAGVYLDGSPTAAFSHLSYQDAVVYNFTSFGDGSSGIQGIANVASFDLTRQSITWSGGAENGTNYWEGVDTGVSFGDYYGLIPSNVIGNAEGWTASARVRVVDASTPLFASAMVVQDQDGTNRWSMMFTPVACYYCNQNNEVVSLGKYARRVDYHIVQMYYDPSGDGGNGAVRYYDDGWLKGTVTRADTSDNVESPRMRWGSINIGATSVQRWNWVEFASGNRVISPIPLRGTLVMLK